MIKTALFTDLQYFFSTGKVIGMRAGAVKKLETGRQPEAY